MTYFADARVVCKSSQVSKLSEKLYKLTKFID